MKRAWRHIGIVAFWLSWPALYVRLYRTVRVRIAVTHKEKVLLVQNWYNSGQWQLPGGGIRANESAIATAQRELAEEVAITLPESAFALLGEPFWVRERGLPFRVQVLIAKVSDDNFSIKQREIAAGKWVKLSEPPSNLSDSTLKAFALVENLT